MKTNKRVATRNCFSEGHFYRDRGSSIRAHIVPILIKMTCEPVQCIMPLIHNARLGAAWRGHAPQTRIDHRPMNAVDQICLVQNLGFAAQASSGKKSLPTAALANCRDQPSDITNGIWISQFLLEAQGPKQCRQPLVAPCKIDPVLLRWL